MFKKVTYGLLALTFLPLGLGWFTLPVQASVEVGQMAPDFTATDIHGKEFKLSDQAGKIVVLEWSNPGCPFVKKHYESNNMQTLQQSATDKGVVWVSVVSSAKDKQGNMTAEEAVKYEESAGTHASARILDESGEIGKMYDAKTTPHMFVIGKDGKLAYAGAIDDNPSPDPKTIEGSKNYVMAAIDDLEAGRSVETSTTAPYGCSVKY